MSELSCIVEHLSWCPGIAWGGKTAQTLGVRNAVSAVVGEERRDTGAGEVFFPGVSNLRP